MAEPETAASGEWSVPSGRHYVCLKCQPAIILYPALMTPEIIVGTETIELLMVGKPGAEITPEHVNFQLKATRGFDARKSVSRRPLFPLTRLRQDSSLVEVDEIQLESSTAKLGRFRGVVDSRPLDQLEKAGYTTFYDVRVAADALEGTGCFNLFWFYPPDGQSAFLSEASDDDDVLPATPLNTKTDGRVVPRELQDQLLGKVLERLNKRGLPAPAGQYAFPIRSAGASGGRDVEIAASDWQRPIQSFHPVFRHETKGYFNIGHMSDIHICARQNVMRNSPARAIEATDSSGRETHLDVSPRLGPILNCNSRNTEHLFDAFAGEVDAILVGGDLVDYIKSYHSTTVDETKSIHDIWEHVAVHTDTDQRERYYRDWTDFISFYSLLLDYYDKGDAPVYGVTGNHDAYREPYGISPRMSGRRGLANPGIPADHNLTIYEAILVFGETYHEWINMQNFAAPSFEWFYSVLTPFCDFSIELPNQILVGLGWGDGEDYLLKDSVVDEHGFGHLPRADQAISDRQWTLLSDAANAGKKVILTSHFTFASYADTIANVQENEALRRRRTSEGDLYYSWSKAYSKHNLGTFHLRRADVLGGLVGARRLQLILTGHSHRRGLYSVNRIDESGRNSLKVSSYDFEEWGRVPIEEPAIIVSDSGGPVPRRNTRGEFNGHGSDRPAGTKITFQDSNGAIASIEKVPATQQKPRLVVAVDYFDIQETAYLGMKRKRVIESFESDHFDKEDEAKRKIKSYAFTLKIQSEVLQWIRPRKVVLFRTPFVDAVLPAEHQGPRRKSSAKVVELVLDEVSGKFEAKGVHARTFRRYFKNARPMIAIQFEPAPQADLGHYDCDDFWNTEGERINRAGWFSTKHYEIERDTAVSLRPNLDQRVHAFSKYRAPGGGGGGH